MRGAKPDLESIPLDRPVSTGLDRAAVPVSRRRPDHFVDPHPQPIVMEFAKVPLSAPGAQAEPDEIPAAPLGKRFLAAGIDVLILVAAACLFGGLVTAARGRLEPRSLDIAVLGFIALFWIFFYVDLFTAFALHTPGQAAMGLSVRNLDGGPPTHPEALLRAFGYIVSIVALMLGFLWAAMDSDGMAWHDHISGTVLIEDRGSNDRR
ncbi:MAG: RDD family protein [Terriglobia bacterium]